MGVRWSEVGLVSLASSGPLLSAPHSGAKPSAPVRPVSMNWERRRRKRSGVGEGGEVEDEEKIWIQIMRVEKTKLFNMMVS